MTKKLFSFRTLLLTLMVLLTGSTWATDKTITLSNLGSTMPSTTNTTMSTYSVKSDEGDSYTLNYLQGRKQAQAVLMAKSTGAFIANSTAIPGDIKSVEVFTNTGASSKTNYYCGFSTKECTTAYTGGTTSVNIAGGSSNTFTNTVSGAKYFCISLGNANNGQILKLVITYSEGGSTTPSMIFYGTDTNNKAIDSKFTTKNLFVKVGDATGLTFTVNGKAATYDATNGVTVAAKTGSMTNDQYVVKAFNGTTEVGTKTYIYIPTITSVTSYKNIADNTEAILKMNNMKVSYVSADGKTAFFEDASRGIEAYDLGLDFTAFKTADVNIWGTKTTYKGIAEITTCDSTATNATLTAGTTAVSPTSLTVAQTTLVNNQLRYAKVAGAKITKSGNYYYAESGSDKIQIYDQFKTNVLADLTSLPTYADITCIVGIYNTTKELFPLSIDNISDAISGVSGGVTWSVDLNGNMVFTPTNGTEGTMDVTGIAAAKRPWSSYNTAIKTIKFDKGVNANADNSYMFYGMTNLESVDFTNFNTSAQTTMKGLFSGCTSIKSIDMSALDLSKVENFQQAFNGCSALESIEFGDNTLVAATNFNYMFYGCKALQEANLAKVAPAAVTNVASMFYNCIALKSLDIRALSTKSVSSAANMKNFFGTGNYAATPKILVISKDFGKISTGDYIVLPSLNYQAEENGMLIPSKVFDAATADGQSSLYAYNEKLADYGTYVEYGYIPTTSINVTSDPLSGSAVNNISHIVLLFPDANVAAMESGEITITDATGKVAATDAEITLGKGFNHINELNIDCTPIKEAGTYLITIPAGSINVDCSIVTEPIYIMLTVDPSLPEPERPVEPITGINEVSTSTTSSASYNIAGQRTNANAKGMVIINGKKYMNK